MSEARPIPPRRYQLLGIELTLVGGVVLLGVPLVGVEELIPWAFLVAGLVAVLLGTVR